MDEILAESITNEGPLAEERLSPSKAALKHLMQGFSLNPTFGNPNQYFQLISVSKLIGSCFVHVFSAVQSRDVTQSLSKNWETILNNGTGK